MATVLEKIEKSKGMSNIPIVFEGFLKMGIPLDDIKPKVNVLTYEAWQEKGRQVRKGEKGIKIMVFRRGLVTNKAGKTSEKTLPRWTTVFHETQTDSPTPLEATAPVASV